VITTTALPDGTTSSLYNSFVQAIGGTPPYTWNIAAGALPFNNAVNGGNLTLDSQSGLISGTPGCPGGVFCIFPATSTFTVQVTDSAEHTASRQLSIRVIRIRRQAPPQHLRASRQLFVLRRVESGLECQHVSGCGLQRLPSNCIRRALYEARIGHASGLHG